MPFVPLSATRACFVIPRCDTPALLDYIASHPFRGDAMYRVRDVGCVCFVEITDAPRGFIRNLCKTLESLTTILYRRIL